MGKYDELIKRLRNEAESPDNYPEDSILMREATDAIEELQKAVNFHKSNSEFWEDKYNSLADEKWIPVTEKLPEKAGIYLVWTPLGFGNHLATSYWSGKEWTLRVVAWMPSPKPYALEEKINCIPKEAEDKHE